MELCIVKVKTKSDNSFRKKISYDTEDSRTKENHFCFEICALCLSSTMESARLYMWQNPVGGKKMVRGAEWRETMKECTTARSIFRERG